MKRFITILFLVFLVHRRVHAHDYGALLAQPTEFLMSTGGDERLQLDPQSGVSRYYTAPKPCDTIILRSSCTSSFPAHNSFCHAQSVHKLLVSAFHENKFEDIFDQLTHQVRLDIQDIFGCKQYNPYVMLTPSGTDAEMIISTMALLRAKQNEKKKLGAQGFQPRVLNIVLAAGELGSGTASACGLRYFNGHLPNGTRAPEQQLIEGVFSQDINVLQILARHPVSGVVPLFSELEEYLHYIIFDAIEEKKQVVILHGVHCSKTGMGMPSLEFMKNIKQRYKESLIAVVDMAQMRASDCAVSRYIQENICVLITGSKFFEGPAFSGAVLIPESEGAQFIDITEDQLPLGIKSYITPYEVDARLTQLRSMLLPDKNIGLFLRWSAALYTIKNLYQIPEVVRAQSAAQWVDGVKSLIKKTPHVELLDGQMADFSLAEPWALLGGVNTIVSIKIVPHSDAALSYNQLRKVHAWMSRDINALMPDGASDSEKHIAQQRCLVGQPVLMVKDQEGLAVLRIALGASMLLGLSNLEKRNGQEIVEQLLTQDKIVLEKLSIIGKYFYQLERLVA